MNSPNDDRSIILHHRIYLRKLPSGPHSSSKELTDVKRDITTIIKWWDHFLLRAAMTLRLRQEVSLWAILGADDATP